MKDAIDVDIRVRYAETDQMGVAYYANYLVWFACSPHGTKRPESKSPNHKPQKTANQPVVLGDFDPLMDKECVSVLHRENDPLTSRRAAARGTLLRSAKIPDATARTVLATKTSTATTFRSPPQQIPAETQKAGP